MFFPSNLYDFLGYFCSTANGLAAFYGGPVYLVGSVLYKEDPLDIDIRIPLEEEDLLRRYGPEGKLDYNFTFERTWRKYYDELKQSRRLSRNLRRRIDFQIQDPRHFEAHKDFPRLRVDSAPEGFFEAGRNNA